MTTREGDAMNQRREPAEMAETRAKQMPPAFVEFTAYSPKIVVFYSLPRSGGIPPRDGREVTREEAEGYRRLIAAAPAMRKALEAICDGACWSLAGENHHTACIGSKKIEAARDILRTIEGA